MAAAPARLNFDNAYLGIRNWLEDYRRAPSEDSLWALQEAQDTNEQPLWADGSFDGPFVANIHLARMAAMTSLKQSSELLRDATTIFNVDSISQQSAMILVRSALEASATCSWLIDPQLTREERLRRSNLHIFKSATHLLNSAPSRSSNYTPPDGRPRATDVAKQLQRDLVEQAKQHKWTCSNGNPPSLRCWKKEVPGFESLVKRSLSIRDEDGTVHLDGTFIYGILSGHVHSDLFHTVMSSTDLETFKHHPVAFLAAALQNFGHILLDLADVMGWQDHSIPDWFAPIVYATSQAFDSSYVS